MTGLESDVLIVRGRKLGLFARPLHDSRKWRRRAKKLPISQVSTANWDGYSCTWEIHDRKLWLVGMTGKVEIDGKREPLRLDHMVPRAKQPVLADWVSGILYGMDGLMIAYCHAGFMRKSEREYIIRMDKGVVVDEVLRINPPPPVTYQIEPDGRRRLLSYDPYIYHGFEKPTFDGNRYLMEPTPFWAADGGETASVADPFPPDVLPTGGPFWAMQAEFYRQQERKELEAELTYLREIPREMP